jgi:hypothetical protein
VRLVAICLVLLGSTTARAQGRTAHDTLAQFDAGLTWATGSERLAGAEVGMGADWRGFGVAIRADYQIQQQTVVEQEQELVLEHGSGTLGFALHLAPVRMFDLRLGRIVDPFVDLGLQGGVTEKAGGWAMRGAAYVAAGAAVRFPIPRWRWLPTVFVRWQHRARDPAFVFADQLTVGVGLASTTAEGPPRD